MDNKRAIVIGHSLTVFAVGTYHRGHSPSCTLRCKGGKYAPVPRAVWACRLGSNGYSNGRVKGSHGDWLLTWADGVTLDEVLKSEGRSRELWVLDDSVMSARYKLAGAASGGEDQPKQRDIVVPLTPAVVVAAAPVAETPSTPATPAPAATSSSSSSSSTSEAVQPDKFDVGSASLQGKRSENEDKHLQELDWAQDLALLAVFDGHGGTKASKFCAKKLPGILEKSLDDFNEDPERVLTEAFLKLDKKYLKKRNDDGTTACVCVCDKKSGKVWVANAGDSRAVLFRSAVDFEQLSTDHKPGLPKEKERIEARGFRVTFETLIEHGKRVKVARVDDKLALSRAIGDDQFKDDDEDPADCAVTAVPDVKGAQIGRGHYIVVACDGLWDVCGNEQVAEWLFENAPKHSLSELAQLLAQHAIQNWGSDDNVSVVILARQ